MNGKILGKLSQIGKAFMLPVSILPVAGLLLGIGGSFSNPVNISAYPILDNSFLQVIFVMMSGAGNAIFENLFLIIAVGLTIGFAKKDKGTAALAALVGFVVMNATINSLITVLGSEGDKIDTGAVGAITVAFLAGFLHNKYRNIKLPEFLGFFGGSRFIPIAVAFCSMLLGILFFIIWPPIQDGMVIMGESISKLGYIGTFLYGFILRLSGAVGLHHMIYPMFWWTEIGGVETIQGVSTAGAQNIFFAQLSDPNHTGLFTEGARYFAGRFGTMMFGLPGAAFAMYKCLPKTISKAKAKSFAGLFLSVALTSFVTGITEPLEFLFLFIAPPLYLLHAFFDGLSFMVADIININIGNTFSGGVIDYILFGVLQGQDKTNFLYVIPIGVMWFFLYYFSYKFLILKFNILTPGRSDEDSLEEINADNKESIKLESISIIDLLGGSDNLVEVDACITRLRVTVKNKDLIDRDGIGKTGSKGIMDVGDGVQIIYGAKAILYKNIINEHLGFEE